MDEPSSSPRKRARSPSNSGNDARAAEPQPDPMAFFSTASGKRINVSEKALQEAQRILEASKDDAESGQRDSLKKRNSLPFASPRNSNFRSPASTASSSPAATDHSSARNSSSSINFVSGPIAEPHAGSFSAPKPTGQAKKTSMMALGSTPLQASSVSNGREIEEATTVTSFVTPARSTKLADHGASTTTLSTSTSSTASFPSSIQPQPVTAGPLLSTMSSSTPKSSGGGRKGFVPPRFHNNNNSSSANSMNMNGSVAPSSLHLHSTPVIATSSSPHRDDSVSPFPHPHSSRAAVNTTTPPSSAKHVPTSALRPLSCDLSKFEIRTAPLSNLPASRSVHAMLFEDSKKDGGWDPVLPAYLCCPHLAELMELEIGVGGAEQTSDPQQQFVGVRDFQRALRKLGAWESATTDEWIRNAMRLILWKLLSVDTKHQSCSGSTPPPSLLTPVAVLVELLYRYNQEFVEGHRSVLRRIAEKDNPASTLMVLVVVRLLFDERSTPHTMTAEVSDGWYVARVTLDLPLTQLARDGLLRVGQKVVVWGATDLSTVACHPLEASSNTAAIALHFNGVKPALPDVALGALPSGCIFSVSLPSIHSMGGPIPSIVGTVTRVLPPFFTEKLGGSSSSSAHAQRVVRNALAEARANEEMEGKKMAAFERQAAALQQQQQQSSLNARGMMNESENDVAATIHAQFARDLTEVTTIIVESEDGESVVAVQQMLSLSRGGGGDSSCVPKEGDMVRLFQLHPSKQEKSPPPLNMKVLFVRPTFFFAKVPPRTDHEDGGKPSFRYARRLTTSLTSLSGSSFGTFVDLCVVVVGTRTTERNAALFFCGEGVNVFGVLESSSIPGVRELRFPVLAQDTVVCIHNASFAAFDDSSTSFDVLRLVANEFTIVTAKSSVPSSTAAIKQLDDRVRRGELSGTLQRGRETFLHNAERGTEGVGWAALCAGGQSGAPSASSALYQNSQWEESSSAEISRTSKKIPYYLRSSETNRSTTTSTEVIMTTPKQSNSTTIAADSTALSSSAGGSTSRLLKGPLFGPSPDAQRPVAPFPSFSPHTTSSSLIHTTTATPLLAASVGGLVRHVFGNFVPDVAEWSIRVVGSRSRKGARSTDDNDTVAPPPPPVCPDRVLLFEGSVTSLPLSLMHDSDSLRDVDECSAKEVFLVIPFRFGQSSSSVGNPTQIRVALSSTLLASQFRQISLSPMQLSVLATDDGTYQLAADRAVLLSSAKLSEETDATTTTARLGTTDSDAAIAAASWKALLTQSVVLTRTVVQQLRSSTLVPPPSPLNNPTAVHKQAEAAADLEDLTIDQLHASPWERWNSSFVADNRSLLWWAESEWDLLLSTLANALEGRLFKLSLDVRIEDEEQNHHIEIENGIRFVEKVFFLKDRCPVEDLFV